MKTATKPKSSGKHKEVTAESFVRIAKDCRKRAGNGEVGQTISRPLYNALIGFAEVLEAEAKLLRGMR